MSTIYRPARPDDATACARIIREFVAATPWWPRLGPQPEVVAAWRHSFSSQDPSWVAVGHGAVVGFCLREDDNISGLYVSANARSRGIGKHLLDLAKQNRDWITVWAYEKNTRARAFYKREGLVEVGRETTTFDCGTTLVDIEHRWTRPAP
ncbi:GNAT family N-acetyltransferase [Maritimibacter dapengensis]|uniref:GNAT family N-acetyltransferase n=1 Tax=Maritimibacter dapengensis TaxID=2836868 RepID=A0ABS6SY12_9RHOB|nr:GNAT family N-acetyltransferase [Maritimibacter dapengensis]MBV7377856.1 GNAT family N-acetyltransferase [Maritimibacter dapengensis]